MCSCSNTAGKHLKHAVQGWIFLYFSFHPLPFSIFLIFLLSSYYYTRFFLNLYNTHLRQTVVKQFFFLLVARGSNYEVKDQITIVVKYRTAQNQQILVCFFSPYIPSSNHIHLTLFPSICCPLFTSDHRLKNTAIKDHAKYW